VPEPAGSGFVGNDTVVERLRRKVSEGRLAHALIFSGPEGIGKRTLALDLARALDCPDPEGGRGCGRCSSCRRILAGTHPDVRMISLEDDAHEIKIAQVREVRAGLELGSVDGGSRVFVIDPAERMSRGASNALLKSLEEPPARTHFILITTNAQDLLPTIRSRCQIYHFSPLRLEEIRAAGIDDELVVRWSQGSIGRALASDPAQLRTVRDTLLAFLEHAVSAEDSDLAGLLAAGAELAASKDEYRDKLRALGVLISDLLFIKEGLDDRLVNVDREDRIRVIAGTVDMDRIVRIGDCLGSIEVALRGYVNQKMLTDTLAMALNPRTSGIPRASLL
jgi:DNA polymerase-3 subunit delta'